MRRHRSPIPARTTACASRKTAGNETRVLFDNDSREQEVVLRSNWRYRPRAGTALAWGVTARRLFGDFDLFDAPDRTRVDTHDEQLDVRVSLAGHKAGAFASLEQSVGPRLTATLGGRFDYFSLNARGDWSPRLGLSYDLDPRTTLTAADRRVTARRCPFGSWPSTRATAASTTSAPTTTSPACGGA